MAVGSIIGAAFGRIITSFVEDILMPPVGLLIGKVDFSSLFLHLSSETYATLAAAKEAGAATINTLIAGIPRILYGMAKDGALPAIFAYLHPRFKTHWVGIIIIGVIPVIGANWIQGNNDGILAMILAAVCAWIFSYILVNISVVVLRRQRPDLDRPYKTPLYPLPQVVGTIGMLVTLWYIAPPFLTRGQIYTPGGIMLAI